MSPFSRVLGLTAIAAIASACSSAEPGDDVATADSELTRSVVTYSLTTAAPLGSLQGLALGPSRDGAMLLAESYAPTGNKTVPNLWNGATLTPIPAGPFYTTGSFAYDAAEGVTYFLQYSGRPVQYESLFRYDASGWRQLYSGRFGGTFAAIVFDSTRKVLLRVSKPAVERFDGSGTSFRDAKWYADGPGPGDSWSPSSAAFDEKRGVLVLLSGGTPLERASTPTGAGAWAPKAPASVSPPMPASSTGGAPGECTVATYDPTLQRVVGLCMTTSRGARIVEWDGSAMHVGVLEAGDRLWGPKAFTYDRVQGAFVAADPDRFYTIARTVKTVPNGSPALTSATTATIYATEESAVPVVATDADLDPVTVTLVDPPPGARLDGNMLRWTPAVADEGKRVVRVRLADGEATVEQTVELDVKVLRYGAALPAGDVAIQKSFAVSGPGSLRGRTRNTHGQIACKLTGKNPGVVRASCGITAEICGDPSGAGTSPCSVAEARRINAASVVSENGSFGETQSQSKTCTRCTRWNSSVSGSVDATKGVCVGYRYDTDLWSGSVLGRAESSANGCSGP